jgi:ketosteroid isomerase-like protein
MPDEQPPAVAAVMDFIDAINRGDVNRLSGLMTEDHRLAVFDEPPLDGRTANVDAWHGYLSSFPRSAIYPHHVTEQRGRVAILGHTTGSHLGLPDEDEAKLLLIWVAAVEDGKLATW